MNNNNEGFWQYGRYWMNQKEAWGDPYWQREFSKDMRRKGLRGTFYGVNNRDPEIIAEIEREDQEKIRREEERKKYNREHPFQTTSMYIKMICIFVFFPVLCPFILGKHYSRMDKQQQETYILAWFVSLLACIFGPVGFCLSFTIFSLYIIFDLGDGHLP